MSLKYSKTNSYPYENYPDKTKKAFWLQPEFQK